MSKQLNVGDKIYKYYRGSVVSKLTVSRVTKTQAECKLGQTKQKFYREIDSRGEVDIVGKQMYTYNEYRVETEETKKDFKKAILLSKISKLDFNKCSVKELEAIIEITSQDDKTNLEKDK